MADLPNYWTRKTTRRTALRAAAAAGGGGAAVSFLAACGGGEKTASGPTTSGAATSAAATQAATLDPTKGVLPIVFIQNQMTRAPIPIPIPNLNPLQPPLGVLPTPIANLRMMKDTAKMSPMQAISAGLAEAKKSQDAVTASGSLDVLRYGRVLRPRRLVGVRGAGVAYDGLYYVSSVTSTLARGKFTQSFNLTRNGLISITPTVPA